MNSEKMLLGRQPIVDRRGRTYAYELLFRDSAENSAIALDAVLATTQVLHHLFAEIGVERALGPYRGFLNCDTRMLMMPGVLDMLPTRHVVLEVLETVEPTPAIIARCRELKTAGFTLALDDYTGEGARYADLLPLVDVLKIDLGAIPPDRVARVVAEADTPLIEQVFKQQPGLSVNLLKLANSAALSLARRVDSRLAEAMTWANRIGQSTAEMA